MKKSTLNEKDTLFILGAGVSVDHLYPTGLHLLEDIMDILDETIDLIPGSRKIITNKFLLAIILCLKDSVDDVVNSSYLDQYNDYLSSISEFYNRLKYTTPRSIDDFMHAQVSSNNDSEKKRLIQNIGKILIVIRILHYEKKSLSYNSCDDHHHPRFIRAHGKNKPSEKSVHLHVSTFFTELWQKLYGNASYDEFISNLKKVSFVTFNYDRLLEHFLYNAAKNFFNVSEDTLKSDLSVSLEVHHVYGRLSDLPSEETSGMEYGEFFFDGFLNLLNSSKNEIKQSFSNNIEARTYYKMKTMFSSSNDWNTPLHFIFKSANKIRTYTESNTNVQELDSTFKHLYFLGFSFHKLNVELLDKYLNLKHKIANLPIVYATVFGMKKKEAKDAESLLYSKLLPIGSSDDHPVRISTILSEDPELLKIPDFFRTIEGARYFSEK
jgi:hypothetical protein